MKRLIYNLRWWRWLLSSPSRVSFGFGPGATRNWNIAMDRWEEREPKNPEALATREEWQ